MAARPLQTMSIDKKHINDSSSWAPLITVSLLVCHKGGKLISSIQCLQSGSEGVAREGCYSVFHDNHRDQQLKRCSINA